MIKKSALFALMMVLIGYVEVGRAYADNFAFSGQFRARYESLDGQYRKGLAGSNEALLLRSLLHGRYVDDDVEVGLELQDSRGYLHDSGMALSNSFINSFDVLQWYVKTKDAPSVWQDAAKSELTIGRQTIALGSKRQIDRASFANVIKSFTGVYWQNVHRDGSQLHSFYVVPIERLPSKRELIDDNVRATDKEQWGRRFWGMFYRQFEVFPAQFKPQGSQNTWGELFLYGFDEKDTQDTPTANRHYVNYGARLYQPWAVNGWDFDIEATYRSGERRASSSPSDFTDLSVSAQQVMFRVGYTFAHSFRPNLAFQYYYSSGDEHDGDGRYGQFEALFGGRRTDLNHTSMHGMLTPANLVAAGLRLTLTPITGADIGWDARIYYSAAYLQSTSDEFVIGKYRDVTGSSGKFLGHTLDSRLRFWLDKRKWVVETGVSLVFPGQYIKAMRHNESLENAAIDYQRTTYGYVQVEYNF